MQAAVPERPAWQDQCCGPDPSWPSGQVTASVHLVCPPLLVFLLQVEQQFHVDPPALFDPQGQFDGEWLLALQNLLQPLLRAIQPSGEVLKGFLSALEFQGQMLPYGQGGTVPGGG
ncbi:hypothetical protein GCM10008938_47110 [Deinococcus roseus]|uniref:Uncharacterized protein n=1 Tax=Deinococcus roseus TaxID=392414 RepID=A0ABQ2DFK7_9DEIO|nr:hypothetical protein GCM10008938_47110 [Deinococcus roseus]